MSSFFSSSGVPTTGRDASSRVNRDKIQSQWQSDHGTHANRSCNGSGPEAQPTGNYKSQASTLATWRAKYNRIYRIGSETSRNQTFMESIQCFWNAGTCPPSFSFLGHEPTGMSADPGSHTATFPLILNDTGTGSSYAWFFLGSSQPKWSQGHSLISRVKAKTKTKLP